jgi:hypothetical protein
MNDDDDFLPVTPEQTTYLRKQGNQYAKLSVTLRDSAGTDAAPASGKASQRETTSKEEFQSECRRIFGFYIPAAEKGRLRPFHKTFIARNQSRPPHARYLLLQEIRKYDLSDVQGLKGRFNREHADPSEAKLVAIERLVSDKKK